MGLWCCNSKIRELIFYLLCNLLIGLVFRCSIRLKFAFETLGNDIMYLCSA